MAELVGVIASSITLASVVTNLATSIIQLKDCWDQFREAPDDLKSIMREIEIFGNVLLEIEADLNNESTASVLLSSKPARESLELCMEASKELDVLIQDLGKDIESQSRLRRSYAAAKVVLKKSKVEKHRSRLQNVTRLFSLCQQCYTRALIQAQPELIANKIALGITKSSHHASKSMSCIRAPIHESDGLESVNKGALTQRSGGYGGTMRNRSSQSYTWGFKPPRWLRMKALEFAGLKAPDGWKIVLRTYNIVPIDGEAVNYAMRGDIEGLQKLFASGEASAFDRVEFNGYTLLHYACGPRRDDTLDFLLTQGADPTVGGDFNDPVTPLEMVIWQASQCINEPLIPLFRRLLHRFEYDIYDTPEETIKGVLSEFHGTAEEFLYLQRECCPSYYQMPTSTRIGVAALAASGHWNAPHLPALVRTMLGKDKLSVDGMQEVFFSEHGPATLPHSVSMKIGTSLAEVKSWRPGRGIEDPMPVYKSWNSLFCEFVSAGIDIHLVVGLRSLFSEFLRGYLIYLGNNSPDTEACHRALRIWLADLQACGIDLEQFGRVEKQLLDDGDVTREYRAYINRTRFSRRLIGFSYGSSPDAWRLWWSEPVDSSLADFWDLVDRQTEVMVGAWPEDSPYKML